jgi:hypothetical protein
MHERAEENNVKPDGRPAEIPTESLPRIIQNYYNLNQLSTWITGRTVWE